MTVDFNPWCGLFQFKGAIIEGIGRDWGQLGETGRRHCSDSICLAIRRHLHILQSRPLLTWALTIWAACSIHFPALISNLGINLLQSKRRFERDCKEADRAQHYFDKMDADINVTKADVEKVCLVYTLFLLLVLCIPALGLCSAFGMDECQWCAQHF